MGVTVSTAGRIYKGQTKGQSGEEERLAWENFPNAALIKTYSLNKQVPDSASTASAIFSGVKANFHTMGLNGKGELYDCPASIKPENQVSTILQWAQQAGKDTGFVTTARITHATPAALYAHSADREWECDQALRKSKNDTSACKDIAVQLVENLPGKNVNVIFGGGKRAMGVAKLPKDEDEYHSCIREDKRNLVQEWMNDKQSRGARAAYVTDSDELNNVNLYNTDFILGLFSGGHMPYEYQRKKNGDNSPSLTELTQAAIKRLQRNPNGFFLLVEGGRIDHGLHETKPHIALSELVMMDKAVAAAIKATNAEDTLVIVTADHSHVMTLNGYPERGNDILGTTTYKYTLDGLPYTSLMFTTGPAGANLTWNGHNVTRADVSNVDTRDYDFMPQAAVPVARGSETHGGEDVALYANGPMSHLFHRLHEQSYIAHVMAYASCVGPYRRNCNAYNRFG